MREPNHHPNDRCTESLAHRRMEVNAYLADFLPARVLFLCSRATKHWFGLGLETLVFSARSYRVQRSEAVAAGAGSLLR